MPQIPADQYPYLSEPERSRRDAVRPGYDPADNFTFGLDLILDAVEALGTSA